MRNKLLIFGHYGVPNWGDEAILAGILRMLNRKKWEVTVISPHEKFLRKEHGVEVVPPPPFGLRSGLRGIFRGELKKTYRTLQEADFVLFGGGGLFQENPPRALKIWNFYLKICQQFGKRILLAGNSLGPFRTAKSMKKTGKLLQDIAFFSVREEASAQVLQQMSIPEHKINVATDFAVNLPPLRSKQKKTADVLFSLRRSDLSAKEIKELQKLCKKLLKQKKKVEFMPLQTFQTNDQKLAAELDIPLFLPKNLREVRRKIATSGIVISNRLHAGIFAMVENTPVIEIASRPKITAFFESADLQPILFSGKITAAALQKRIAADLKASAPLRKMLAAGLRREKRKARLLLPDFF